MKKLITLLVMLALMILGSLSASAMDSQTLLENPGRYRVISTQPDGIVYADMNSLQGMQTMDYPNSIENISCVLYVEKYAGTLDAMAFQKGNVIRQISEYQAAFHANKQNDTFQLDTTLTNVYTPQGQAYEIKVDTIRLTQVKDMFIALHRLSGIANH